MASTLGFRVFPDATAYCASKFGVVGFTRALAVELAGRVGVTMLVPGGMHVVLRRARSPVPAGAGRDAQRPRPRRRGGGLRALPTARVRAARARGDPGRRALLAVARPRLLVLRALGLGDLLTAVPALRALAAAFPDHRRVLAAPRVLEPLARLSGAVDEVLDARPLAALPPRTHGADVAVNLHGRGPESHRVLLATAPRRLLAFAHPAVGETAGGPRWRAGEHEVARWCRLLAESGVPADPRGSSCPPPPRDPRGGAAGDANPPRRGPGRAALARRALV